MTSATSSISIVDDRIRTPAGRRPYRFSLGRLGIYLFLGVSLLYFALPLYIMLTTSLKPIEEVRHGTMLALPQAVTIQPWIDAWLNACTGAACEGLQPGFWNSVRILLPGTVASIALGAVNGYVLSFWRVKWANAFLLGMIVAAFLPYQVMVYPLVRLTSAVNVNNSVAAAVLVHTIYHMPITTLIFRNYFVNIPIELFKAARVDGAGFWRIFFSIILPLSIPIVIVSIILSATSVWNDFLIGLTFAGRLNYPMTVQLNNIVGSDTGAKQYNVEMAATLLTSLVPLAIYFFCGRWFIRGITAGGVKG
jgi:glucose/mannose transport system permease protein